MLRSTYPMSIFVSLIIFTIYVRFGYRSINFKIFSSSQVRQNLVGPVVAGKCRAYMSSLIYCIQTKYGKKQSLLWNLCVLLTYMFLLLRIVKFYTNNYKRVFLINTLCSTRTIRNTSTHCHP